MADCPFARTYDKVTAAGAPCLLAPDSRPGQRDANTYLGLSAPADRDGGMMCLFAKEAKGTVLVTRLRDVHTRPRRGAPARRALPEAGCRWRRRAARVRPALPGHEYACVPLQD